MDAVFFSTPMQWREWLTRHHQDESEILVGYWKVGTGRPSITWSQSVDEALCFGWIDGLRRRLDDESFVIRFTPRKPGSHWSKVNVEKVGELTAADRMAPAGLAAFGARREDRTAKASFERTEEAVLDAAEERAFRADAAAWEWFSSQPPWYRRTATHWVVSPKRPETRGRRLATLVGCSREGRSVPPLTRP